MASKKPFNSITYKYVDGERPKLMLVKWKDHNHTVNEGWKDLSDVTDPQASIVRSVGWAIASNKDCVALVSTFTEYGNNLGAINILKNAIIEVTEFQDGPWWSQNLEMKERDTKCPT